MNNFQNIPDNELFDPSENMLAASIDKRVYHRVYLSAEYAVNLVENGTPQSLARAEDVVRAVLKCQELDKKNPHYGNFFWEKEEGIVEVVVGLLMLALAILVPTGVPSSKLILLAELKKPTNISPSSESTKKKCWMSPGKK